MRHAWVEICVGSEPHVANPSRDPWRHHTHVQPSWEGGENGPMDDEADQWEHYSQNHADDKVHPSRPPRQCGEPRPIETVSDRVIAIQCCGFKSGQPAEPGGLLGNLHRDDDFGGNAIRMAIPSSGRRPRLQVGVAALAH